MKKKLLALIALTSLTTASLYCADEEQVGLYIPAPADPYGNTHAPIYQGSNRYIIKGFFPAGERFPTLQFIIPDIKSGNYLTPDRVIKIPDNAGTPGEKLSREKWDSLVEEHKTGGETRMF